LSSSAIDRRIQSEVEFHDERFGDDQNERKKTGKYYAVLEEMFDRYYDRVISYAKGKELLEYGCGAAEIAKKWLEAGVKLTGIDISPVAIEVSKNYAASTPYKDNAKFYEMNAEQMSFEDDKFDVVCGSGIIHHLDIDKSYKEIVRVLKKDGKAVFVEPLGHHPLVNYYRKKTPHLRTPDEHPLLKKDLDLLSDYFEDVNIEYYALLSLGAVPFRNTPLYNIVLKCLLGVDKLIFKFIPPLRHYAWFALIDVGRPKK